MGALLILQTMLLDASSQLLFDQLVASPSCEGIITHK